MEIDAKWPESISDILNETILSTLLLSLIGSESFPVIIIKKFKVTNFKFTFKDKKKNHFFVCDSIALHAQNCMDN